MALGCGGGGGGGGRVHPCPVPRRGPSPPPAGVGARRSGRRHAASAAADAAARRGDGGCEQPRAAKRSLAPADAPPPKRRRAATAGPSVASIAAIGTKVDARYINDDGTVSWYGAVITAVHGDGFTLDWDDGDTAQRRQPKMHVRLSARPSSGAPPSSSTAAADTIATAAAATATAPPAAPNPSPPTSRLFTPDGQAPTGGMPAVAAALARIGLQAYVAAFDTEGYDDLEFLRGMDAVERADVAKAIGMRPGHAGKFVKHGFERP
ncbi:hypothetical protein EMIHUDRAFT_125016 [Emiliania huxleyi CCMP1516]|uniref:SAM domain-containing protein n=2 Tax=Emiliania huxleyi TaxID=2903 RepID=A0A0D3I9V3_EMIH1|nr:hypothetical protein EMIHUDRAFT_125016 [Emiliania huxleyi CCMP1516]EOD08038.1 hypothetical protein EMIHUDRAFT_125016 [Emiliania huxleyi CCMP1516]|eukprot:XP_005760467.1 hypothetical protein EMIHUDRAFT_125016 [Emiliania huxleyi CCMP1516]